MDYKNEKSARERELDDFWDIDSLLPRRQKPLFVASSDTSTVSVELPPKGNAPSDGQDGIERRRFIPPHTPETANQEQIPETDHRPNHALIRRVRIYKPKSNYQYYEAFVRDALRLYPIHGEACEHATFFSYAPQYSQMSRAQLEWYLWWRENLRNGTYLATDYSYVLLYVYELINLSERLEPRVVQAAMLDVWEHYRETYHQLDGYLSEWVCDFGLLHGLTIPEDTSPRLLAIAMSRCTLREYYFTADADRGYTGALLAFCNNYDYRKSKFYIEPNKVLFDTIVHGVIAQIVDHLSADGRLFSETRMDDSKCMRNAYAGALCAYRVKRNIEVEYCSFSRSNELRYFITDVIKYTENLLRAHLGIRSRLTVYSLPTGIRNRIDAYVKEHLPSRQVSVRVKKEQEEAAYERFYDLPRTPLSLSRAAEIEQASWETTERLVDAFEGETIEEMTPPPIIACESVHIPEDALGDSDRLLPYSAFLQAALEEDADAQQAAARSLGKMMDAVADVINEIAVDLLGDIILEDIDGGFGVIEDYIDQVRTWIDAL